MVLAPVSAPILFAGLSLVLISTTTATAQNALSPGSSVADMQVTAPPEKLAAPKFYTKYISAGGYPIVASSQVSDYALKEAAYLADLMLRQRPDVRDAMIASGSRMCIIAWNEFTTDLPEWRWMADPKEDNRQAEGITARDFWDARARGMGGSETDPFCSCGEENLLAYEGDPYSTECILIHEFAHNIHLRGLINVDPTFDPRLKAAYTKAMAAGLWKGKYASVNHHEYFAEGVQSWFDNNREDDHDHNHVNTRAELMDYDPDLAALCREVFRDTQLSYTKPATRLTGHLAGYDPGTAPVFHWPERLATAKVVIRQQAQKRSASAEPNRSDDSDSVVKTTDPALLTVDRLFGTHEFDSQSVPTVIWSRRSNGYYSWQPSTTTPPGRDLVFHDLETSAIRVVAPAAVFVPLGQAEPLTIDELQLSDDESQLLIFTNTQRVWRKNTRGDYWVLNPSNQELRKLGGDATPSTMMFARFAPDGSRIAFVRENNIYVQSLNDLSITQLTSDGSSDVINGTSDWVYEEELGLRDGFRWSSDGQSIAFWQLDTSDVRRFFLINNTDDLYSRPIPIVYPKVGEKNSAARIGVVSATGGEVRWLNVPGDPRNHYLAQMEWTPDSTGILLQQFNRLQTRNVVFLADASTGECRQVFLEEDPAWLENDNPIRWLNNGSEFLWISERSGWRSAYRTTARGTTRLQPIIDGAFDVIAVDAIDETDGWLYFSASPDNATQRQLFRSKLSGSRPEPLSPADQKGWHTYDIAPNAHWAIHTFSNFHTPPIVEIVRLPDHHVVTTLADNKDLREKLLQLKLPVAEFRKVAIAGDLQLDAWCLHPEFEAPVADQPIRKLPVLIHVYGEPHGQTVRDAWQGPRGLWHWMLAQQGYIVASVDNRGTMCPRGRAWRKIVHRQIGILAPADQAAALKELCRQIPQADADRVAIWGWSGGGSMSLNAILQFPDLYHTAMAVAPVPDQRLYDTIYQERYMGLPDSNADGYRRGSPITYAKNLTGHLLLIHGTGDDNCHYQGVEKLVNELIAHDKLFTVMPYPNRTHAISEGPNTSRHLYRTMTRFLEESLPLSKVTHAVP